MTSKSAKFRLALLRVGEYLTENDVQNLAFLCEGIKPARRELLRNARELFVELQGRDLLNEQNVSVLCNWLKELNLLDALRPLQEYSEVFLQSSEQWTEKCIEHNDQVLKYFCVTCESKVCLECVFSLHDRTLHDVIKLEDISDEADKRRLELQKEIEKARKGSENIKGNWEKKKAFYSKCREKVRKEIQKDTILIHKKAEERKLNLLKKLDEKEILDFQMLMKEREEIEHVVSRVGNVNNEVHEISSDSLSELRKVSKAQRKFTEIQGHMQRQEIKVRERCVDLLYKKMPNDGVGGTLTLCSLVGGVMIRKNQLVHIYDERQESEGVRLVCIDPKPPSEEHWRHLVVVDDFQSPTVVSCTDLWYDSISHLLFSVGKTVFVTHPNWTGPLYDSVGSVSSLVINEIDEESWISSIYAGGEKNQPRDKFLISISNSSLLRQYRVSGEALRTIQTKDLLSSSIINAACVENQFAVISRGRDYVITITADAVVNQSGTLRPPSSSPGLLPICSIWTGATWLVLFVTDGESKEWKVLSYEETGRLIKVCAEGKSHGDTIDVPVSVTRFQDTGFVSFADSTIGIFKHGKD